MPITLDPTKNFAKVTVSTGYSAGATSIVLNSGQGALLPTPGTQGFNLVWWDYTDYPDPSDDPNVEIVRCTGISTDTLTVTRAQEGTIATAKNIAGKTYKMINGPTSLTITEIQNAIPLFSDSENLASQYNGSSNTINLADAPNPAASLILNLNNTALVQGTDYTLSGNVITLSSQWVNSVYVGTVFVAWYRY